MADAKDIKGRFINKQYQRKDRNLYHTFCLSQAKFHINRRNFSIGEKYVKQALRSEAFDHKHIKLIIYRVCDFSFDGMKYELTHLQTMCHLFSGEYEQSRVCLYSLFNILEYFVQDLARKGILNGQEDEILFLLLGDSLLMVKVWIRFNKNHIKQWLLNVSGL